MSYSYPGQSLQDIMKEVLAKVQGYAKAYETIPDVPESPHPCIQSFL